MRAISSIFFFFFFNDTATTEIYTLSLHDALPICPPGAAAAVGRCLFAVPPPCHALRGGLHRPRRLRAGHPGAVGGPPQDPVGGEGRPEARGGGVGRGHARTPVPQTSRIASFSFKKKNQSCNIS